MTTPVGSHFTTSSACEAPERTAKGSSPKVFMIRVDNGEKSDAFRPFEASTSGCP